MLVGRLLDEGFEVGGVFHFELLFLVKLGYDLADYLLLMVVRDFDVDQIVLFPALATQIANATLPSQFLDRLFGFLRFYFV